MQVLQPVRLQLGKVLLAGAGSLGDKLDADTDGDDQYKVENVYADAVDTDGSGDAANNGQDDAYDAYKVASAAIEVIKRSAVYYDPINGEDPSAVAIPGSLILYCITVKNTGTENAVDVTVVDDLTTETVTNSTIAFADSTTVLTNDITSADSIRFSTTDDCTAALWDSGTDESSDGTDGSSDGLEGDYNVTSPNKVTTKVPTLAGTTGVSGISGCPDGPT